MSSEPLDFAEDDTPEGEPRAEPSVVERNGLAEELIEGERGDDRLTPFNVDRVWASSECFRPAGAVLALGERAFFLAEGTAGSLDVDATDPYSGVGGVLTATGGWPEITQILPWAASTDGGGWLPRRREGETGEVRGLPRAEATC